MDKRYEGPLLDNDDDNDQNLKLIALKCGANGLGIRLSKSSWDPFPFVSHVDDNSTAHEQGIEVGDCVLKVNGHDCLGRQIQDIAKRIHNRTDDDNNEVNLLLWRSTNLQKQQGYQPQLLHNLVSDLINVLQLMECPVCMETPAPSSYTYQCVNGHIVCQKCRLNTLRCPLCRVQLGRGRCLVADKILQYLHNNSSVKIGLICDSEKTLSKMEMNDRGCQRSMETVSTENEMPPENLHVKRSTFLPFKLKLKTITFWKNS